MKIMLDIGFLILYLCSCKTYSDTRLYQEKFSRMILNPDTQTASFVSFADKSGFTHPYPPSLIESSVIKTKGIESKTSVVGVLNPGKLSLIPGGQVQRSSRHHPSPYRNGLTIQTGNAVNDCGLNNYLPVKGFLSALV